MTEIWFVPTDENTIEDIFEAMKQCQSLHPDPERKSNAYYRFYQFDWINDSQNTSTKQKSSKHQSILLYWFSYFHNLEFSEEEEDDDFRMAEEAGEEGANIENLHIEGKIYLEEGAGGLTNFFFK